jgi:SAM-dependent methyltransferase
MSNDNKSIHEFDFDLICEYFSSIKRQGPGSPETTRKALGFIDKLDNESSIVDLGCGTGAQTMVLAQNVYGQITGIDLFPAFIDIFNQNAADLKLQDRVKGITGTMEDLPFGDEEFDLIWSEGAIYNIGFKRGINEWYKFLKPRGYLAVTEATWFTEERPVEIDEFWKNSYPEIDTLANKVIQMQKAGYILQAAFVLPRECWTDHYYIPQIAAQEAFLKKHAGNRVAEELVTNQKHEAELYKKYNKYYGYVFYIGQKI